MTYTSPSYCVWAVQRYRYPSRASCEVAAVDVVRVFVGPDAQEHADAYCHEQILHDADSGLNVFEITEVEVGVEIA